MLGLVATGVPLIFFAAQVKPYATDVAVALGLLALGLAVRREGPGGGRLRRLALAGALAPWLSYPALLVGAGLLAALVANGDSSSAIGNGLRRLALVGLAWAVIAAGTVAWARGHRDAGRRPVHAAVLGPRLHAFAARASSGISAGRSPG